MNVTFLYFRIKLTRSPIIATEKVFLTTNWSKHNFRWGEHKNKDDPEESYSIVALK